jgi:hypothetical protein
VIGENFKRLNRKRDTKLEEALEDAKVDFTKYAKNAGTEGWNWDELNRLERKVEIIEYELWCAEYEDNRKRNWK